MTFDHMMDWGAMGGFMWVAMLIWTVLGIALVVLVIVGVVWLVRQLSRDGQGRRRPAARTAIEDLELRYARGEVDRETFLAIREDLERDGG
jgi:putative membrane protein